MHDLGTRSAILIKAAVLTAIAYFAPLNTTLTLTGMLVVADLLTGIAASVKTGKRITSSRFGRTISKTLIYLMAICVAFVAQGVIIDQPILKVVTGFIALREVLSVFENLNIISGTNLMSSIIDRLSTPNDKHDGPSNS